MSWAQFYKTFCRVIDILVPLATVFYADSLLVLSPKVLLSVRPPVLPAMEHCALENVNIYSYIETSGVQSYYIYLHVVHFFNSIVN
jgi:hypothetical protein